jgi:hypothetical protein
MKRLDLVVAGLTAVIVFGIVLVHQKTIQLPFLSENGLNVVVGACGNGTLTPTDSCTSGLAAVSCSAAQKTKIVKVWGKIGVDSAGVDIMGWIITSVNDGCSGSPANNVDPCLNAGGSKIDVTESGDQEPATNKSCNGRTQKVKPCVTEWGTKICRPTWRPGRNATCGGSWPQTKSKTSC